MFLGRKELFQAKFRRNIPQIVVGTTQAPRMVVGEKFGVCWGRRTENYSFLERSRSTAESISNTA
ncbi:hypothetical protein B0H19DRAFT_1200313 [Mycena capillaripes]|nr:hypothetical protein B0H19DRAFT_1200313 [Mycena capillaripes]